MVTDEVRNSRTDRELLEMPFNPRRHGFVNKFGGSWIAHIDARDVQERFDDVLGPTEWQVKIGPPVMIRDDVEAVRRWNNETKQKETTGEERSVREWSVEVAIGVSLPEGGWAWKADTGIGSDPKNATSDGFKRAAVHWGVGRYIYTLRKFTMRARKDEDGRDEPEDLQKAYVASGLVEVWMKGPHALEEGREEGKETPPYLSTLEKPATAPQTAAAEPEAQTAPRARPEPQQATTGPRRAQQPAARF